MNKLIVVLGCSLVAVAMQGCVKGMGMHSKAKPVTKTMQAKGPVSGESTNKLPIGKTYSATPPRLVREEVQWENSKTAQSVAWDSTVTFGPVPANVQAKGNAVCRAAGGSRARGYHPRAMGVNGKVIPGGGFLCG